MFFLNDLYDYMGDVFSHNAFCRQYNLNVNYLHYYRRLDSLPTGWKNILKNSNGNKPFF